MKRTVTAPKIGKFIERLTSDPQLLKQFCARPRAVLKREGISVPEGMVPAGPIDQDVLLARLKALQAGGTADFGTPEAATTIGVTGPGTTPVTFQLTSTKEPEPDEPKEPEETEPVDG